MSKAIHLVSSVRLEISDVRSLCAVCGQFVDVSLQHDSALPENATENRSKVTCRSCLRLMRSTSARDGAALQSKVSVTPDFGETWAEREAVAEKTAKIDFGCEFKENTCVAMRKNHRGCCCQSCASRHGFLEKIKPSAFDEILPLFDRVWGFWRPGAGCMLPRKWLSPTCLFYACLPFMNKKDRHNLVRIAEGAGESESISKALALSLMDAASGGWNKSKA